MGAGTGRLTVELVDRCDELVAVEPAAPLRRVLAGRVPARVDVREGFFDAIPVPASWADLVCTCSALRPDHGEDALRELERICRGVVVIVWPNTPAWLVERGYEYVTFAGDMALEYESWDEAKTIAQIFYPDAVGRIGSRTIPYEVLGVNPPRDLCWKRVS